MLFNISTLRPNELLERAELAISVHQPQSSEQYDDVNENGPFGSAPSQHELYAASSSEASSTAELTAHILVRDHTVQFARRRITCGTRRTSFGAASLSTNDWETLDVSDEFRRHLSARNGNLSADNSMFRIRLRVVSRSDSHAPECDWIRSIRPTDMKWAPTLVVYTSSEQQRSVAASRRRRALNG